MKQDNLHTRVNAGSVCIPGDAVLAYHLGFASGFSHPDCCDVRAKVAATL